jgi:hypothetical protein
LPKKKTVCIVWAPSSSRMDTLSAELNARKFYLTFRYGPRYFAPLRYLVLFFRTGLLLLGNDPDVIIAQNPPIFCPLTCMLYAFLFRKKVVVDHHAVWSIKTFANSPLRKPIRFFEKLVCRAALSNTTPHPGWESEFRKLGARHVLTVYDFVPSALPRMDVKEKYLENSTKFLLLAPHGGHELERIENEVLATERLPRITLLITGPPSKLSPRLNRIGLPPNVRYIGFLPFSEYSALLSSTDIGLNISDEPMTISHCLLQFASSGIPAISSRQKVVEDLFGNSLCYVDSSQVEDIASCIEQLTTNPSALGEFKSRIERKQVEFESMHEKAMALLKASLEDS